MINDVKLPNGSYTSPYSVKIILKTDISIKNVMKFLKDLDEKRSITYAEIEGHQIETKTLVIDNYNLDKYHNIRNPNIFEL